MVYQVNKVDATNPTQPYKKTYVNYKIGFDIFDSEALYYYVYFNKAKITTDKGIIFEELQETIFYEHQESELTYEFPFVGDFGGNFFSKTFITMGQKFNLYKRAYIKIPEVIARVGGFLSVAIVVIEFIYGFYLDNHYNVYLYTKLFRLEIERPDDNKINLINDKQKDCSGFEKSSIFEMKDLDLSNETVLKSKIDFTIYKKKKPHGHKPISKEDEEDIVVNKEIYKLLHYRSKKRERTTLNELERCIYVYLCRKKGISEETKLRVELITAADRDLEEKAEIFQLWQSLDQFRLVQKLILNECQTFMIKNRGLQIILNDAGQCNTEIREIQYDKFNSQKKQLIDYLKIRKEKGKISTVDALLLKYLHPLMLEEIRSTVKVDEEN